MKSVGYCAKSGANTANPRGSDPPGLTRGSEAEHVLWSGPILADMSSVSRRHFGIICPYAPGHVLPMIEVARELRDRGNRVTFYIFGDPGPGIEAAGFQVRQLADEMTPPDTQVKFGQAAGASSGTDVLRTHAKYTAVISEAILRNAPQLVQDDQVEALLIDQVTLAGSTVADLTGIPYITICNALMIDPDPSLPPYFLSKRIDFSEAAEADNAAAWQFLDDCYEPVVASLNTFRAPAGLAPFEKFSDGWSPLLQITQEVRGLEPRTHLPEHLQYVGPLLKRAGDDTDFPWVLLDGRPLAYVSMGTMQNRAADRYRTIAEGCAGTGLQLVITTGRGLDPAELGDLPGDPVVVPFAPQTQLLERCELAITSGGLNGVMEALHHGKPMLVTPIAWEQPGIAARVEFSGAGRMIATDELTADAVHEAVVDLLTNPNYREAAAKVAAEIDQSPGARGLAELVEQALSGEAISA